MFLKVGDFPWRQTLLLFKSSVFKSTLAHSICTAPGLSLKFSGDASVPFILGDGGGLLFRLSLLADLGGLASFSLFFTGDLDCCMIASLFSYLTFLICLTY